MPQFRLAVRKLIYTNKNNKYKGSLPMYIISKILRQFAIVLFINLFAFVEMSSAINSDVFDHDDIQSALIRRDIKIPIGKIGDQVHHITLQNGIAVSSIPEMIRESRNSLGLTPEISPIEQNEIFMRLPWLIAKFDVVSVNSMFVPYKIFVTEGQTVQKGENLGIFEAMKMHLSYYSPIKGKILRLPDYDKEKSEYKSDSFTLLPDNVEWEEFDPNSFPTDNERFRSLFHWFVNAPEIDAPVASEMAPISQNHETVIHPSLPPESEVEIANLETDQMVPILEEKNIEIVSLPIQDKEVETNLAEQVLLLNLQGNVQPPYEVANVNLPHQPQVQESPLSVSHSEPSIADGIQKQTVPSLEGSVSEEIKEKHPEETRFVNLEKELPDLVPQQQTQSQEEAIPGIVELLFVSEISEPSLKSSEVKQLPSLLRIEKITEERVVVLPKVEAISVAPRLSLAMGSDINPDDLEMFDTMPPLQQLPLIRQIAGEDNRVVETIFKFKPRISQFVAEFTLPNHADLNSALITVKNIILSPLIFGESNQMAMSRFKNGLMYLSAAKTSTPLFGVISEEGKSLSSSSWLKCSYLFGIFGFIFRRRGAKVFRKLIGRYSLILQADYMRSTFHGDIEQFHYHMLKKLISNIGHSANEIVSFNRVA